MKKIIFTLFASGFGLILPVLAQSTSSQSKSLSGLDEFIVEQMDLFHVPGLSASIILGNSVVWNNNFGFMNLEDSLPVTDSTLFNVFSLGKSVTAACVMQLWEEQRLGLDQNINDFLPFQIDDPWVDPDSISARMLMTHTSRIDDGDILLYGTTGDPTTTLHFFLENYLCPGGLYYSNSNFLTGLPGTMYSYSNYGAALNGFLVEALTGISFKSYAHDSLLAPLEMSRSAWFLSDLIIDNLAIGYDYMGGTFQSNPHYGHPAYPGIFLRSSALELSKFVIMLLNQGDFHGTRLLASATIDSMTTIQNPAWQGPYGTTGLGLYRREDYGNRIVWGHNGGSTLGYAAHFYFCREENSGIVITTNSNQYVDPIVLQLFEYAAMFVIAGPISKLTASEFTAHWSKAYSATGYMLDVALDENFITYLSGYENLDVGQDTLYTVSGLTQNTDYYYRLRAYNETDTGAYSNTMMASTFCVGVDDLSSGISSVDQQIRFKIFPNPITSAINLEYELAQKANIKISIYDHLGREIRILTQGPQSVGKHRAIFDISTLPSGIYLCRLQVGDRVMVERLVKL